MSLMYGKTLVNDFFLSPFSKHTNGKQINFPQLTSPTGNKFIQAGDFGHAISDNNEKFNNRASFKNIFGTISSLSLLNKRSSP